MLASVIEFVGPNRALELFGVKLVGFNAENGKKLLFTLVLIAVLIAISKLLRRLAHSVTAAGERTAFWTRQGIHVFTALVADRRHRLDLVRRPDAADDGAGPGHRRPRLRAAAGRHGAGGLRPDPARPDVQRRRPHRHGRRARRRDRARASCRRRSWRWASRRRSRTPTRRCGSRAASTPAASSRSPTRRSSTSRSSTTPATSPTSGRRSPCPSPTRTTARPSSASCSTRPGGTR